MTTLPFDFDIFLRSGSTMKPEIAASVHGARSSSSALRSRVENSQVRMMSWPWGRRSNGATRFHSSGSRSQPAASCGVSEEVAQVSKMSFSPAKPPGTPRCSAVKPSGTSVDGSTGQPVGGGEQDAVVVALAVLVERVPDRDRHAEEALARDEPVAGEAVRPVLEAHAHEVGMPRHLAAEADEPLAQLPRRGRRCEVPLPRRDDLERAVALLVELHDVGERLRVADELARLLQQLDDALLGAEHRLARELGVGGLRGIRRDRRREPRRGCGRPGRGSCGWADRARATR